MKKLVLFLLPLLAVGCAASPRNGRFTLKEPIYAIVDSFILRHSDKDLFELYIDKTTPFTFDILLFAGSGSLTGEENIENGQVPLVVLEVGGKSVDVYSGAERYITTGSKPSIEKNTADTDFDEYLLIRDSLGIITTETSHIVTPYPFLIPIILKLEDVKINR